MLGFNALLRAAGVDPTAVRLLRHETQRHGGRTPYALWRDDTARFDDYQRVQKRSRRAWFNLPIWASFVVAPGGKTLFVGCFETESGGVIPSEWIDPISGRDATSLAEYELYDLKPLPALIGYSGRVVVDWGVGTRTWSQRAINQDKPIVEMRERFIEPSFPGYDNFVSQLSELESLPPDWLGALAAVKGVYLLTCPRTREQYVGSACGDQGLLARWRSYARDGHGGNVALKSRKIEDYRVSILQVAGSRDDQHAILAMETLWKAKLQSREMGLNRN